MSLLTKFKKILCGLGSVGSPSYTFVSDENTGMWSPAADTLAWSSGGVERMRVNGSGNVGIKTISPTTPLDVVGEIGFGENNLGGSRFKLGSVPSFSSRLAITYNTNGDYFSFYGKTTNGATSVAWNSNYPFDISPGGRIVYFGDGTNLYFQGSGADFSKYFEIKLESGVGKIQSSDVNVAIQSDSGDLNVGVGTTSPSAKLHTLSTTEQFRSGYDTNNYWRATTSSTGITTFDAVGSGASFIFSDQVTVNGNLTLGTAGNKINITEGSNASVGVATLVAGTVTVNTTAVTANSRIFLTRQTTSGTLGTSVDVTARVAGTSFTITSNGSVLDTSTVAWFIIN